MKTLRYIGMAIIAVIMSINFAACSDDDEGGTTNLAETTWKIISCTEDEQGDSDPLTGKKVTFKSDGTIVNEIGWTYTKWALNGDKLTITFFSRDQQPDDNMIGTIVFNGNRATYTYHWEDFGGGWKNETTHTVILEKQ